MKVRCRWCEKVKPARDMAVFSYKVLFGHYTGVCTACMTGPGAEQREAAYLERGMNKTPTSPKGDTPGESGRLYGKRKQSTN